MNFEKTPLQPGLYLVSTPIGNARDLTLRALDVLALADEIAAEDTRTARRLMEIHGVPLGARRITAYHDHSGEGARARLVEAVLAGRSVAYVSEAGTPLVADPGFALARAVVQAGGAVQAVPGASAVLSALAVAGLPTDRFLFAGFLPAAQAARRRALQELASVPATLVFYESPRRVREALADMRGIFGEGRQAALCRELTKKFEEVLRGTLQELEAALAERDLKGEVVILVDRGHETGSDDAEVEERLRDALRTMRVKDAATAVAGALGRPRREVYQIALEMEKKE